MIRYHEIYLVNQLPVFQNQMRDSEYEAKNCIKSECVSMLLFLVIIVEVLITEIPSFWQIRVVG